MNDKVSNNHLRKNILDYDYIYSNHDLNPYNFRYFDHISYSYSWQGTAVEF